MRERTEEKKKEKKKIRRDELSARTFPHLTAVPRRSKDVGRYASVLARVASLHLGHLDSRRRAVEVSLYSRGSLQRSSVPTGKDFGGETSARRGASRVEVTGRAVLPVPRRRHARRSLRAAFQLQSSVYPAGGG